MLHLQQTLHQQGSNRKSLQDSQTSIGMQKAQTNGRSQEDYPRSRNQALQEEPIRNNTLQSS